MHSDLLQVFAKKNALTLENHQGSCNNTSTDINLNSTSTNIQGIYYIPIFIELKSWAHSELEAYKSKFRVIGLSAPNKNYIDAHLKVYSLNCQIEVHS